MKLTTLRVHGFKSFADVTEIHFHEGITTIVGPNGCGKSNISDAIRWVLGEQRPTAIRGAKMEEAIFQGSVNRRPVNRGSVHMTVSNEDNLLPVPFEEVEIGRTVYRDGGSDYAINRSTVRLRDVVDLVRDTGLGANAYNVIENRMIDAILSDRADERRALFEEASGIGKYKDRRKAATRRLERAEMDLQRLEDVIAEVQTKVRSLARQKGKAERYLKLRARRLSVEVAVVRNQLDTLEGRMAQVEKALTGGAQEEEGRLAEVQTTEARVEALRISQVDAEKARGAAAERLEEVKSELVRWERDLAVAEERAAYAERRLGQIGDEREEGVKRLEALEVEAAALEADAGTVTEELTAAREELERCQDQAQAVRSRLLTAREALEKVESRERDVARRGAQLEGDAAAAEAQASELERRLERLQAELGDASEALTDMEAQGDLFGDRLAALAADVEEAAAAVTDAGEELTSAKEALSGARTRELEAVDRSSSLEARCAALADMDQAGEGLQPAARALLEAGLDGVLGTLVDFVTAPEDLAGAVEGYLGPLALGIVVRDGPTAAAVGRWFLEEWKKGGGLVLLPLDRVPDAGTPGTLLAALEVRGEGAPWVRALLGGVDLVDHVDLDDGTAAGARLGPESVSLDPMGVVRLGNPSGAAGLLERREKLKALRVEAEEAALAATRARQGREEADRRVAQVETALDDARARLLEARETHRKAGAEIAEQVDRKDRLDRHRDELARQVEGTRAARSRALERGAEAREDRQALLQEETNLQDARGEARKTLGEVQEEWEAARAEESRLTVLVTRLDGESNRLQERLENVARGREAAVERARSLDEEERSLREELDTVAALREEGAKATEALFSRREEAEDDLRRRSEALEEVAVALREEEGRARQARQAEREASDRLHRLELERQELDGRIGRIRDRLEGEWGRPLEDLMTEAEPLEEEDPEALQEELREIVAGLERIGPVNMLAVEEHEEESQRLSFLQEQHGDLVEARNDLRSAIRQINETATALFSETFEQIRENFRGVHRRLFEGGEADIWLAEEEDPLESAIEIHASPRGKKTQRIDLLSGGERALTALSLLFAIYLVKPSPFCVLDEVDAPLDENNIGRFIRLLEEFKSQTQFIVITHNPRTIEAADWIYGVTMEEPGVSRIVGVRLEDALEQAKGSAA